MAKLIVAFRKFANALKIDLKALGPEGVDWINLAEDRDGGRAVVNGAMNFEFPTMLEVSLLIKDY
jgi:hypothetical protein